jgi:hypothetical protein
MEEGRTAIVEMKGHQYYVVDQDMSRGDRTSDGPALSNFFIDDGGSTTVNNVRESHRLKNRMELAQTVTNESQDRTTDEQQEDRLDGMRDKPACEEGPSRKKKSTALTNVRLRPPKAGIRCTGRNETTRQLWLNEFYVVHEGTGGRPVLPILREHEQPGPEQRACYGCGQRGHLRGDSQCPAGPDAIWEGAPAVWKDRIRGRNGKGGRMQGKQRAKGKEPNAPLENVT